MCDPSQDGYSCLMSAVLEENLEIVEYLCEVGGKELMVLQNKVWPIFALEKEVNARL
jgi:hypothetical protein